MQFPLTKVNRLFYIFYPLSSQSFGNPQQIVYMGVSKNSGTPKSSILIGFSLINHPFWGTTTIFGKSQIVYLNLPTFWFQCFCCLKGSKDLESGPSFSSYKQPFIFLRTSFEETQPVYMPFMPWLMNRDHYNGAN